MPLIRYKVTLNKQERAVLQEIATRGKHSSQKVLNALILLGCDEGPFQDRKLTAEQIAGVLPVSMRKVDRVKRRFVEYGLEAALDKALTDENLRADLIAKGYGRVREFSWGESAKQLFGIYCNLSTAS